MAIGIHSVYTDTHSTSNFRNIHRWSKTSITIARGDTICLRPLQVDSIFTFIRQVAPVPACWLFKTSATSWLNFDLLTLKVVSESRVTWATSVPILVFLGLSVLELGPMYTTDKRQTKSLNASALWGRRHNKKLVPWGLTVDFPWVQFFDPWSLYRFHSITFRRASLANLCVRSNFVSNQIKFLQETFSSKFKVTWHKN